MEENSLIDQRRAVIEKWRNSGKAFPNNFKRDSVAGDLHAKYGSEEIIKKEIFVQLAGRMMSRRIMGKAAFAHLQDMSGQIQLYLKQSELPGHSYQDFKQYDIGDILGVRGEVFKTKTGELSVRVLELELLTKAVRPLPEKFHGLTDREMCYRQRYLDLLTNPKTHKLFQVRSRVISLIRDFLLERRFLEVETPMLHSIAGGATARPFITHHNALDMPLYLRIAPELYLKRLVVGGFEKVFEINRSFRNEGLSTRHNPEFTMLEFYEAYANYQDHMQMTQILLRHLVEQILGKKQLEYGGQIIDFKEKFKTMTLCEAILQENGQLAKSDLMSLSRLSEYARSLDIPVAPHAGVGWILTELFEKTVEKKLIMPTFITHYPYEVSPLARRNDTDPFWVDRFELFIGGKEIANGFSELNDPDDQSARFKEQMRLHTDEYRQCGYDQEYITALEYGLPPTAGEGIGIDRLLMLLTDSASIRDVILFPQMRSKNES